MNKNMKRSKGRCRHCRQRPEDLKDDEPALLQRLFARLPRLHPADTLREELTAIFQPDLTKEQATEKFNPTNLYNRPSHLAKRQEGGSSPSCQSCAFNP